MSFGQELKDFTAAFSTGYNIGADRRDKKWERERQKLNDPIDRDYKAAATEGMKLRNKWYEPIADLNIRTGEKNLEWADRKNRAAIDASDASIYRMFMPTGRGGKPAETLEGTPPEGEPDASGAPVGDHGPGATVDDSATDSVPDASQDSSGEDNTDAGDDAQVEQMSYHPASSTGDVYSRFMKTVYDSGVKNPNGLAAIAATANRESKFSPTHAYGSWSDPSESGAAGTAGGIMSWRGNRYLGLQKFAAKLGDNPRRPSPEVQAKYLFHEDPALKDKLNSARSPQEAQQIMNNAWAFVGYDRDSPERRARFETADKYAQIYGQYLAGGGRVNTYSDAMAGAVPVEQQALPVGQARPMYTGGGRNNTSMVAYPGAPRRQAVVHAAVGGVVPSIDDEEDPNAPKPMQVAQAAPQQALPVDNAPVPTQRPVDQPAPEGGTSEGNATPADVGYDPSVASDPRVVGFTKAHEAVLDGIRYSLQQMGLAKGAAVTDPDRAAKMAEFLKGSGAAPKAIIDQAYKAVDPDNELPESERTMAALGTVYDHYLKRGEPAKAKAAAASIVQYQRKLFQQYSSIAKAAVADGDIDAATKAAVKAYSSVPDGQDMKVSKMKDGRYQITITDEATGKTVSKPVLTPQEIGGWAMKVSPGSFDQFIMDAAGQRKQGGGAPSEDFQKLAAGLDEGKVPSNAEMAALPLAEQKELRMRAAAAAKAGGAGEDKPLSFGDSQTAKAAISTAWDEMVAQPELDENGQEQTDGDGNPVAYHKGMGDIRPEDKRLIQGAAAQIFATPKNRTADYDVTEADAISAAFMVAQSPPDAYKVTDDRGGKVVELSDGTTVWMRQNEFLKMSQLYKRHERAAAKKKQDEVNASEDAAAKSKASNKRAGQYEKDNPAFMAPPGTQPAPPSSGIPAGNSWDLPLGAPQSAIDDLQKLMGQ